MIYLDDQFWRQLIQFVRRVPDFPFPSYKTIKNELKKGVG
jgi:hypothetical protein